VCFRYNCDSDSCFVRGYLGLINTATSSRTVYWDLDIPTQHDDAGVATLAAGQQRTILSDVTWEYFRCGSNVSHTEMLQIRYDSAGWSPRISATDRLLCA
jgi:hypothetical protein